MNKGILLYCFDTPTCKYHKILERCVRLIQKNLNLEITVVTNYETFKSIGNLGMINYKLIDNETNNKRGKEFWYNLDRHTAYDMSPYDKTILMDIDYFCFTNNLLNLLDIDEDFLIHDKIHDLTGKDVYNFRKKSIIPILWATVIVFEKTADISFARTMQIFVLSSPSDLFFGYSTTNELLSTVSFETLNIFENSAPIIFFK